MSAAAEGRRFPAQPGTGPGAARDLRSPRVWLRLGRTWPSVVTTVSPRYARAGSMGRRNLAGSGLVPLVSLRLPGVVRGGRGQAGPATCLRHGAAARLLRQAA